MKRIYFANVESFRLSISFFFLLIFSVISNAQLNFPTSYPDRIILNLTENCSQSIAITWRTDKLISEGFCEWQQITGTRIIPENSKNVKAKTILTKYEYTGEQAVEANQHSAVLQNLEPGKKYLYRVGVTGYFSEWFEYRTPELGEKFTFVYFGDPQTDIKSQWSRVVRQAYSQVGKCAFMLYAGDIINRGGRDVEWHEWFDAGSYIFASVPQVLTPGNHDYMDTGIDPHWKYQFSQPQNGPKEVSGTCFFVDYNNLKIISIDSAIESELEDENGKALSGQKAWLDSVLSNNKKEWIIITTHLPFYSTKESRDNPQLRKHFQPIIEKYNVDMVLTGHDHAYGRGVATDNPDIKPSVVYVVSVSGPKLYESGNKAWMQKKSSMTQLYQKITIEDNKLIFKAISADGQIVDEFMLKKRADGKNRLIESDSLN